MSLKHSHVRSSTLAIITSLPCMYWRIRYWQYGNHFCSCMSILSDGPPQCSRPLEENIKSQAAFTHFVTLFLQADCSLYKTFGTTIQYLHSLFIQLLIVNEKQNGGYNARGKHFVVVCYFTLCIASPTPVAFVTIDALYRTTLINRAQVQCVEHNTCYH